MRRRTDIRCFDDLLCPTNTLRVVSVSTCQQMSIIFALEHKVLFAKTTVKGTFILNRRQAHVHFEKAEQADFGDPLPLETSG